MQMKASSTTATDGRPLSDKRLIILSALAVPVSVLSTLSAKLLLLLIAGITQLMFFGRWSLEWAEPGTAVRGAWVILIPAIGGGIIAVMARYGSRTIIGHGIPEVMQQILTNRSRISPKIAILKPLSSAISIGTGGPYGAEGPVIATGSAIGSLIGQVITITASERKTLLCAGAAAGMTAVFGCPVAATLLAVELLLFELNAKSIVPVAIAAAVAQALRFSSGEPSVLFPILTSDIQSSPLSSTLVFALIGICAGVLAIAANAAVNRTEHAFTRLPTPWMWNPVIGGLAVGLLGWIEPRVFGASYGVIESLLRGDYTLMIVASVCFLKLLSWVVSLGSGTSGGTLAPMLVIGGGLGTLVGAACNAIAGIELSLGLAALAGMTAFFASGSRAVFASIILAVEITQEAMVLWPVSIAAAAALGVAYLLSHRSIMSSPVEFRGFRVPMAFDADVFSRFCVSQVMKPSPTTISEQMKVAELADAIASHAPGISQRTALIVTDANGLLAGIITRSDLFTAIGAGRTDARVQDIMTPNPICAYPDEPLQAVIDRMHANGIGRAPVVARENPKKLLGYLGRAEILSARQKHWSEQNHRERGWL